MKSILASVVLLCSFTAILSADSIEFVPPTDPVGFLAGGGNDAYDDGRGMVFEMQNTVVINSVGSLQDLTGISLQLEISQTIAREGDISTGETILFSETIDVSTNGLEWVDFQFAPIVLEAGNFYHFELTHFGSANDNFFYTQGTFGGDIDGIDNYDQGDFLFINGTNDGNTDNFVVAAFRASIVPEPTSASLLTLGLVAIAARRRR